MSVMIGGVTERLAPDSNFMEPSGVNDTLILNVTLRDAERVRVAAAVTVLSGLFQVRHMSHSKKKTYVCPKMFLDCLINHLTCICVNIAIAHMYEGECSGFV